MENKKQNPIKKLLSARGVGQVVTVFCGLIVLCFVFNRINPNFWGDRNRANLLRQIAPYIIIGIGQGYVLITANIDLSIGSVVGMSCMMSATLMCNGMHPLLALLITMAACITTGALNSLLADATARVQPPTDKGRRLKIYYMTQAGICPPHFVAFCNDARLFHFSYQRYLENQIREVFGLQGTPVRITIRQKGDKEE